MQYDKALAIGCAIGALVSHAFAAPTDIVINDRQVFPESLGSTTNGTLYIGGSNTSRIYRAQPGQQSAEPWISKADGDFHFVLGVLVDEAHGTLWVCDNILSEHTATLKTFALNSGKRLENYSLPNGGVCNDIALKGNTAYISDTLKGRVLELSPGANELKVWYSDPSDPSLDGLVWAKDGKLYTNTYFTNHLIRIEVNGNGSAGKGTVLKTSLPLYQPDGMRLSNDGRILMVEGQGRPGAGLKEGRLDEVTIDGDSAIIKVLKSGFELPTAVTAVGRTAWVLESKFDYQRNEELKGKDPGSFHVFAVPVPKGR
jgi:sugar lactone lactonase YvrE